MVDAADPAEGSLKLAVNNEALTTLGGIEELQSKIRRLNPASNSIGRMPSLKRPEVSNDDPSSLFNYDRQPSQRANASCSACILFAVPFIVLCASAGPDTVHSVTPTVIVCLLEKSSARWDDLERASETRLKGAGVDIHNGLVLTFILSFVVCMCQLELICLGSLLISFPFLSFCFLFLCSSPAAKLDCM